MARGHTSRNIYIVGAQSTGKTTLVRALQDHFSQSTPVKVKETSLSPPGIITEVARTVLQEHHFTADDITSSPTRALALQQLILQAQVNAEKDALRNRGWFISDRSGADPIVYARKYVGEEAANGLLASIEWHELKSRMADSLIVVCEAGMNTWLVNDGVRLMPGSLEDWVGFHQLFCASMISWGFKFEILPCSITGHSARLEAVLRMWESR